MVYSLYFITNPGQTSPCFLLVLQLNVVGMGLLFAIDIHFKIPKL